MRVWSNIPFIRLVSSFDCCMLEKGHGIHVVMVLEHARWKMITESNYFFGALNIQPFYVLKNNFELPTVGLTWPNDH